MSTPPDPSAPTVKRYEIVIAAITLIGTLIVSLTTLIGLWSKQIRPEVSIANVAGLREALRMPLEGTWSYVTDYSRFHKRGPGFKGEGKAVITWDPAKQQYAMLLSGMVVDTTGDKREVVVVHSVEGTIPADQRGVPIRGRVAFSYLSHMGRPGFQGYTDHHYLLNEAVGDRPTSIQLVYKSTTTTATTTLHVLR